jgi:hypothetical protein
VILSTQTINPMPVIIGSQKYPENIAANGLSRQRGVLPPWMLSAWRWQPANPGPPMWSFWGPCCEKWASAKRKGWRLLPPLSPNVF